jgi:glutamate--cysteine ligase
MAVNISADSSATQTLPPAESQIIGIVDQLLRTRGAEVEAWLDAEFARAPQIAYSSVDVRHAGFKIAPVDTNLFPAGFNNLSTMARMRAADAFAGWFHLNYPGLTRVLLLPENHTRNLGYLDNVATLFDLFLAAGLEVRLGSLSDEVTEPLKLPTLTGREVTLLPTERVGDTLQLAGEWGKDWVPQILFLNNDLTAGVPSRLQSVVQPIVPSTERGWHLRRKSVHFRAYDAVVERFAATFDIDPWLLRAETEHGEQVSFKERTGLDAVAEAVERVLARTRAKYTEYGIAEEPYVYVKADSGTYGMGIMTVKSGAELLEVNKKIRNKMNVIKEGAQVSEVAVQEGVPTANRVGDAMAEPVIYLVGGAAIGGAYRVNDARDAYGNLNATGMYFTGMCDPFEQDREPEKVSVTACSFNVYGLVARLATLAAAHELEYA